MVRWNNSDQGPDGHVPAKSCRSRGPLRPSRLTLPDWQLAIGELHLLEKQVVADVMQVLRFDHSPLTNDK